MNIAYLNILWIMFTLAGLIIFGWVPSTIALYATWRKIIKNKDRRVSVFGMFFKEYKNAFIQKNMAGLLMVLGGLLISFYLSFYQQTEGIFYIIYTGFIYIICFLFINLLIYLPPVMVHFKLSFFQYFKQALMISLSSPLTTLFFYTVTILLVCIFYMFPSLILPFGFSTLPLIIMNGCLHRFKGLGF